MSRMKCVLGSGLLLAGLLLVTGPSVKAGLVSQWSFDGDVLDSGGGGNDGTYLGGGDPLFVEGRDGTAGGALSLDGAHYVRVAQKTALPVSAQPVFSLAFWVKGLPQSDMRVFSEGSTSSSSPLFNLGTHRSGANGSMSFYLRNDSGATAVDHRNTTRPVFDDSWHHVAWVDDGGAVTLYIDGLVDPTDFSYTPQTLTADTTTFGAILRAAASHFFTGAIDDARLYDHALTIEELQAVIESDSCPDEGDTTCAGLSITGPPAGAVGLYTITASGSDSSGDTDLLYTFQIEDAEGTPVLQRGPQTENSVSLGIGPGTWTVSVTVDDDLFCFDTSDDATCTEVLEIAPEPQLVSHWSLDATLDDSEPNANHGTFVGADGAVPTYTDGFDGTPEGAISLNGVDEYIDVLTNSNLPLYYNPSHTVALWVKGEPQADKRVYSEGLSTDRNTLVNIGTDNSGNTGAVDIFIRNNSGQGTPVSHRHSDREAFDGTWHHIAWVDDNGTASLYIDGVRDAGMFNYTHGLLTPDRVSIGGILRDNACCWFAGEIDDVRVYNHALSAQEVSDLVPEDPDCEGDADTHCSGLTIDGPDAGGPGTYTATSSAVDDSGDPILYTFTLKDSEGEILQQVGPGDAESTDFNLLAGSYTITCLVDDFIRCKDQAEDAVCTEAIEVAEEPEITVAHWSFDGDLIDDAGGNNLTFVGEDQAVFAEGYDCAADGALSVDGVDDYAVASPVSNLPLTAKAVFTIAIWVKGDPQGDRRIFSESSTTNTNPLFNLGTDNTGATGALDFFLRDDTGTTITNHAHSTSTVFDGTWHHVAWVDDQGTVVLYVDGQPDAADFSYTRPTLTVDTTTLGGILRDTACCWLAGSLDDAYLFNYALSQDDVLALYGDGPSQCCPEEGDTHCAGLTVDGPEGNAPGTYTLTASAADDSGDAVLFTFTAAPAEGDPQVVGPQAEDTAQFDLGLGDWTLSVSVDDDPLCPDEADDSTCTETITVAEAGIGPFRRGDANTDGKVDLSDGVSIFNYLFLGGGEPECLAAADTNGQGEVNITSGIYVLNFLFLGGPAPLQPFPDCGISNVQTDADLGCVSYTPACD